MVEVNRLRGRVSLLKFNWKSVLCMNFDNIHKNWFVFLVFSFLVCLSVFGWKLTIVLWKSLITHYLFRYILILVVATQYLILLFVIGTSCRAMSLLILLGKRTLWYYIIFKFILSGYILLINFNILRGVLFTTNYVIYLWRGKIPWFVSRGETSKDTIIYIFIFFVTTVLQFRCENDNLNFGSVHAEPNNNKSFINLLF